MNRLYNIMNDDIKLICRRNTNRYHVSSQFHRSPPQDPARLPQSFTSIKDHIQFKYKPNQIHTYATTHENDSLE